MRTSLAVGYLAICIFGSPSRAELVYFARGGQSQLSASVEGEQVRLETPNGPKVFLRTDFRAIVPGYSPEREWVRRRDSAIQGESTSARLAAAWWALENGLTREAVETLEAIRPLAASHEPTRRAMLGLDLLALPCPDPDLSPLKARLRPHRFREARSAHVILLHQLGEADAAERLDVLERVVQTFMIAFASQGIDLSPLRRRLVSVYFADRRDYAHFLRLSEAEPFADTQGYFHPTLLTVLAYDGRSSETQKTGRRAIANRKREGETASELARQTLFLDLDWRTNDLGIAAHETIHQLTVETGLAPRFDDFPLWLHEGLAAQFEVVRGGRWAGFGRTHDLRLPDWRSIKPSPRLAPLIRDSGFGHGYQRDLYAKSWALVYFLRKTRPREFLTFLDLLRTPVLVDAPRPDRGWDAFRAAFGTDLAGLEAEWRTFIDDLKTPLESERPPLAGQFGVPRDGSSFEPKTRLVEVDRGH